MVFNGYQSIIISALYIVIYSRGNKAAANLRPSV